MENVIPEKKRLSQGFGKASFFMILYGESVRSQSVPDDIPDASGSISWPGTGMQMEVYENEVIFRPRNYLSNKWYGSFEYSVTLH